MYFMSSFLPKKQFTLTVNNAIKMKFWGKIRQKLVSCVECRKESNVALALLAPAAQRMV